MQLDWHARQERAIHAGGGITRFRRNLAGQLAYGRLRSSFIHGSSSSGCADRLRISDHTVAATPRVHDRREDIFPETRRLGRAQHRDGCGPLRAGHCGILPDHQIVPLNVVGHRPSLRQRLSRHMDAREWSAASCGLTADASYVGTAASASGRARLSQWISRRDRDFARYTRVRQLRQRHRRLWHRDVDRSKSHSTYHALQTSSSGTIAMAVRECRRVIRGRSRLTMSARSPADLSRAHRAPWLWLLRRIPSTRVAEKGPSSFDVTHSFYAEPCAGPATGACGFPAADLSRKRDEGLGAAEHLQHFQRRALHCLLRHSADRRWIERRGPARSDRHAASIDCARKRERTTSAWANRMLRISPYRFICPDGTAQTRDGSVPWDATASAGPAFYDFDFSLIKDTPSAGGRNGSELTVLQFRSEFFNIFNIVNMGLPANTIAGSGFGVISRTAGNSRQIQFSLKLLY